MILQAVREGRSELPVNVLLLIVPRHPQRFDEVARMVGEAGLNVQRRSELALDGAADGSIPAYIDVLLGDSMGEMFAYYAACDCSFVGGSLLPLGGQNLIEPAALGKPVLIGPHTFNFAESTEDALAAGGAQRVADAAELVTAAARLLRDDQARATMGRGALAFANQYRGATRRTLALLAPLLKR